MEKIEYHVEWGAYPTTETPDYAWENSFDKKEHAKKYLKENGYVEGKVRCCCSIDAQLSGNEFGYGDTEAEALRNLKAQVKEYGYMPYDPYKE